MSAQGAKPTRGIEPRQPAPDAVSDPVAPSARPATLIAAAEEGVGGSDVSEPKQEEIARLAYSYWEARGGEGGSAEEDWLRAEQELRTR